MFASTLDVRATSSGRFTLLAPLVYTLSDGMLITVPSGFETDFASIPRALQVLPSFGVNGKSRPAAVLHDWCYARKGKVTLTSGDRLIPITLTRKEADELFREALVVCGVNRAPAQLMYLGVRSGGWAAWK